MSTESVERWLEEVAGMDDVHCGDEMPGGQWWGCAEPERPTDTLERWDYCCAGCRMKLALVARHHDQAVMSYNCEGACGGSHVGMLSEVVQVLAERHG